MADKEQPPKFTRRMTWMGRYSFTTKDSPTASPNDLSPLSRSMSHISPPAMQVTASDSLISPQHLHPLRRTSSSSLTSNPDGPPVINTLERSHTQQDNEKPSRYSGTFSRMSFSSVIGGLSALSLRSSSDESGRGRSWLRSTDAMPRASSALAQGTQNDDDNELSRTRSMSPFRKRIFRPRDVSPSVEALKLSQSDVESDIEGPPQAIQPRSNAFSGASDDESDDDPEAGSEAESDEIEWSDNDTFDLITTQNTEQNSLIASERLEHDGVEAPDPLGEGVNIIVPPEPIFPTTLNSRNPRRRKSTRHEALPISTSRPIYQRDRCTITLTQGDPTHALELNYRRSKRYVVASDLSEESRYAIEWAVGTVIRDGDELIVVSVNENEAKVDPPDPSTVDRLSKMRIQQERQTLAYILVRQVTTLLQRTKLQVSVTCQAWHAKNARHMLLDITDHAEPTMMIVGSRGLGKLRGILLGSTSHYLVQKCSVPVMVARRRLKRPPKRSAHLTTHHARVSLAEAARVERLTPKVDQEVEQLRDQLQKDQEEDRPTEVEDDADTETEADTPLGRKVRGSPEKYQ